MIASSRPRLSYEQYCQIEGESSIRHEYQDGQAWAMAGGSREHAAIAANLVTLLSVALRGARCQVHTSDLRIRVSATGLATYPDVSVVCGQAELDPEDRLGHTVTNPRVLVEVLSPSTEKYDRIEKLLRYQSIQSVDEIVLVNYAERKAEQRVEVWRRGKDGAWVLFSFGSGLVELTSIGATFSIDEVYRDPLAANSGG